MVDPLHSLEEGLYKFSSDWHHYFHIDTSPIITNLGLMCHQYKIHAIESDIYEKLLKTNKNKMAALFIVHHDS